MGLSKVSKNYTQRQLFEAMQQMFLSTLDDGESRFQKFKTMVEKFGDDI